MRVKVKGDYVDLVENVYFPQLIQETSENCYYEEKSEDPFYICDLGDILYKHKIWSMKLPRIEPFYAVKCNPHPMIINLLANLNIGFDCASKAEIAQVLNCNVSPDRIIYANPCKQASHIRYAEVNGIQMITFDSIAELRKIHQIYPKAQLVIRIFVGAALARCPLGLKFGAQLSDVPMLLDCAQSLELNVIGVSFHVGSGCFDASAYENAIKLSDKAFHIAQSKGYTFTLLDIGGGFPGNFDNKENIELFQDVCTTINVCIDELFPLSRGVRIISEPGRFYVSSAFQLSCTVTSLRSITKESTENSQEQFNYYLNDGVYGSFNCVVFDHYIGEHYLLSEESACGEQAVYQSTFWGPTCDSADKILENVYIRKLSIGERINFKGMGAYTMAAASRFNGFELPFTRFVASNSDWVLLSPLIQEKIIISSEEECELFEMDPCASNVSLVITAD